MNEASNGVARNGRRTSSGARSVVALSDTETAILAAQEAGLPVFVADDSDAAPLGYAGVAVYPLPAGVSDVAPPDLLRNLAVVVVHGTGEGARDRATVRARAFLAAKWASVKVLELAPSVGAWVAEQGDAAGAALKRIEELTSTFAPAPEPKLTQGDWMYRHAAKQATFFHTPSGDAFARYDRGGVLRTCRVSSREFSDWLSIAHVTAFGRPAGKDATGTACHALEAHARDKGECRDVFMRVGLHEGRTYLDLANAAGEAVEIDLDGWRVVTNPPVLFERPPDMAPLPRPQDRSTDGLTTEERARRGFDALRPFISLGSEGDALILWAWLVFCVSPSGDMAHLTFEGEAGTGKTWATATARRFIDPAHKLDTRNLSMSKRDLMIATRGTYVLALDNLSSISKDMSDGLCRIATGSGHAERKLTTDAEEAIFQARRPIVSNGITNVVERSDLASRTYTLRLVKRDGFEDRDTLLARLDAAHPVILAGLLECVYHALISGPIDRAPEAQRLVQFRRWARASAYLVGGKDGKARMVAALDGNQDDALLDLAEADDVVTGIVAMLRSGPEGGAWRGTMTALLDDLRGRLPNPDRPPRGFPANARALSHYLTRRLSVLRAARVALTDEGRPTGPDGRNRVYSLSLIL